MNAEHSDTPALFSQSSSEKYSNYGAPSGREQKKERPRYANLNMERWAPKVFNPPLVPEGDNIPIRSQTKSIAGETLNKIMFK